MQKSGDRERFIHHNKMEISPLTDEKFNEIKTLKLIECAFLNGNCE